MEFWLVVGLILGIVLGKTLAADMGSHLNPDTSWMHRPGSSQPPHRPSDD